MTPLLLTRQDPELNELLNARSADHRPMQAQIRDDCDGRAIEKLRRLILDLQDTLTSIERCRKPVIAAIHVQARPGLP
jgi:enoyl-CoA hydratase/carnithine racemase